MSREVLASSKGYISFTRKRAVRNDALIVCLDVILPMVLQSDEIIVVEAFWVLSRHVNLIAILR